MRNINNINSFTQGLLSLSFFPHLEKPTSSRLILANQGFQADRTAFKKDFENIKKDFSTALDKSN